MNLIFYRHVYQITLVVLSLLQKAVYDEECGDFESWRNSMTTSKPTFCFFEIIRSYIELILLMVKAHRSKSFNLYVSVLEELVPLFFSLNHQNYARWLSIYIRDLKTLPESVRRQFIDNHNWTVSKTLRKFSSIPIDEAHEQQNKILKSAGGVIGLLDNPSTLR
ncbi:MAG: hypothetical protein AAGK05_18010 [Pseudomonadota bacterium]